MDFLYLHPFHAADPVCGELWAPRSADADDIQPCLQGLLTHPAPHKAVATKDQQLWLPHEGFLHHHSVIEHAWPRWNPCTMAGDVGLWKRSVTCSCDAAEDADAVPGSSLVNSSDVEKPLLRPWPGHVCCLCEKDRACGERLAWKARADTCEVLLRWVYMCLRLL